MGTNAYGYAYDAIGNRLAVTNNAEAFTYTANALNQYTNILRVSAPPREDIPAYDLDGNLTNYNGWTFTWSGENRLILASNTAHRVEYAYDYQGRMIQKVVEGQTNSLIWDAFNIIQSHTHSQTHTLTNSYLWGLDLSGSLQGAGGVGGLLAEVKDGVPYFAAFDANGNVTEYLSTNGTIAAHYEYSPFGEIVVQSGDLADSFIHRFSTKPWCAVTRLSEYEFRMYSLDTGRWLSRDPLGEGAGLLLYSMCGNNGIGFVDALGLATTPWPPPGGSGIGLPVVPPIGVLLPGDPDAEGPRIAALFNKLVAMCPTGNDTKQLLLVKNPPQCCRRESCAEQALVFATEIVHRATGIRQAFKNKWTFDFPGGQMGNSFRNIFGSVATGEDGYRCEDWVVEVGLAFSSKLKTYEGKNELCFRGAEVEKGSVPTLGIWWTWPGIYFDPYHTWFLVYGPMNPVPGYLGNADVLAVDP